MKIRLTNEGSQGNITLAAAMGSPAAQAVSSVAPAVVDAVEGNAQAERLAAVGVTVTAAVFEPAPSLDAGQLSAARNFATALFDLAQCCA